MLPRLFGFTQRLGRSRVGTPVKWTQTPRGVSCFSTIDVKDEYGTMDDSGCTFRTDTHPLESGTVLRDVNVRYKTFGSMNETRDNVMVVCHALTGNASLDSWWGTMLGPGLLFDTDKYFVVCANILGSCYGTTGPTSQNPATGERYGTDFPDVTVRDSVSLHMKLLKEELNVNQIACVIGGSLGGMQALEWGFLGGPNFVRTLIPMCCGAFHQPWQIAISETQRQAIYADPKWSGGDYDPKDAPMGGLSVARQIAMVTYRSHAAYGSKFGRHTLDKEAGNGQATYFDVEQYLRYQGLKFCTRFDPLSYVKCTRLMDSHDVGRGRGGVENALRNLTIPTLVFAVDSDGLYPPEEQRLLERLIPDSELHMVHTPNGHDGFLLNQDEIMPVAQKFLKRHLDLASTGGENSVTSRSQASSGAQ